MTAVRATGHLAKWANARKGLGVLLPDVAQFLMQENRDDDRPQDVLHPSEMSKKEFCQRAATLRLMGIRVPEEVIPFTRENVFDEGHAIHEKHQNRFRRMGTLFGRWRCGYCKGVWLGMPPEQCDQCGAPPECIRYAEVPLFSETHRTGGHADGEVRNSGAILLEIKSMSVGSLRIEAPKLLRDHTYKVRDYLEREHTFVDHDTMWRELRSPLGSAGRQGQIYLALRAIATEIRGWPPCEGIDYIYENKHNQQVKEFFVRADQESQDELMGTALDVVWAARREQPLRCPKGNGGCAMCAPYEEAWGRAAEPEGRRTGTVEPDRPEGAEEGRGAGTETAAPPRRRPAPPARGHNGTGRPPTDGQADRVHSVGRLLDRAARAGRS